MNKRILLGVLIFTLGATGISYLAAQKPAHYENVTKIKTPTPSGDPDRIEKKILDRIKEAAKPTPRTAIRDEKDVREIYTPPARETLKSSSQEPEVIGAKLEKATREKREGSSEERIKIERIAEERKAIFIDDSKTPAKEKTTREKPGESSKELTRAERIAEERKTNSSDDSKALVVRTPVDIVAAKSGTSVDPKAAKPLDSVTGAIVPYTGAGAIVPAAKPLDSVTGAIVPYKGKSSELATTSSDEKKSGMSGKQKALVGAGVVGAAAGVVGLGAAAGVIGLGAAAFIGNKDKPTEGIAPEQLAQVEDIKGLDAGSGSSASFGPSPIPTD